MFHSLNRKTLWSAGTVGVVALTAAGCGSSTSGGASAAAAHAHPAAAVGAYGQPASSGSFTSSSGATAVKISLRSTSKGKILVAPNGHALYAFTRDARNQDRCAMISGCKGVWPLQTTRAKPVAGSGVQASKLSMIKVGNVRQVTYAGHPLYTYVGDTSAGSTDYIGISQFGGAWPAVTGSGALVK